MHNTDRTCVQRLPGARHPGRFKLQACRCASMPLPADGCSRVLRVKCASATCATGALPVPPPALQDVDANSRPFPPAARCFNRANSAAASRLARIVKPGCLLAQAAQCLGPCDRCGLCCGLTQKRQERKAQRVDGAADRQSTLCRVPPLTVRSVERVNLAHWLCLLRLSSVSYCRQTCRQRGSRLAYWPSGRRQTPSGSTAQSCLLSWIVYAPRCFEPIQLPPVTRMPDGQQSGLKLRPQKPTAACRALRSVISFNMGVRRLMHATTERQERRGGHSGVATRRR